MPLDTRIAMEYFNPDKAWAPLRNFGTNLQTGIRNAENIAQLQRQQKLRDTLQGEAQRRASEAQYQLGQFDTSAMNAEEAYNAILQRIERLKAEREKLVQSLPNGFTGIVPEVTEPAQLTPTNMAGGMSGYTPENL